MTETSIGLYVKRSTAAWVLAAVMAASPLVAHADEPSPALKQLIADANKEGRLDLQWASSLLGGIDGVTQEVNGMNTMFGTNIVPRLTPDPGSVPQLLNKIGVTQAAGQPSPTDAFVGTTVHIVTAVEKNMLQPVAWKTLLPGRIDDSMVEADGLAVRVFTTLPGGIVYNTKLSPEKPTSLMNLLKPEWTGKIASTPYAASFELLSATDMWGEARTLDYARKFSKQVSGLIGCPELERVASGEFLIFAMDCSGRDWVHFAKAGAPIGFVVPSDYAAQRYYYMVIPKNAGHPNAGKLFVTYLLTTEGQNILWKTGSYDLHTFPDSHMKQVIADYEKQGIKFREFTLAWWKLHPEVIPAQAKVVDLLTKQQ